MTDKPFKVRNSVSVGNATVNSVANSSQITFSSGAYYANAGWYSGNSTVNAVANSTAITIANSTVTFTIAKPTLAQQGGEPYYMRSDGSWVNVETLLLHVYDSANTRLFP